MSNINPEDRRSTSTDQSDFSSRGTVPVQDISASYKQKQSGFGNGFLIGFLSGSVLWLLLGGVLWFTQLRNFLNTAPNSAIVPTAPATQSPQSPPSGIPEQTGTANSDSSPSNLPNSNPTAQTQVGQAPSPVGLNLQANHPNGTTLRVEQVKFTPDSVTVALNIVNGAEFDITLNTNGRGMYLRDDQGNNYNISPPPTNQDVKVPAKTTARGEFVFWELFPQL